MVAQRSRPIMQLEWSMAVVRKASANTISNVCNPFKKVFVSLDSLGSLTGVLRITKLR